MRRGATSGDQHACPHPFEGGAGVPQQVAHDDAAAMRRAFAVLHTLQGQRYACRNEEDLLDEIEHALLCAEVPFERAKYMGSTPGHLILVNGVAVYALVHGSVQDMLRRMSLRAGDDDIHATVCVGPLPWLSRIAAHLHGKPIIGLRVSAMVQ